MLVVGTLFDSNLDDFWYQFWLLFGYFLEKIWKMYEMMNMWFLIPLCSESFIFYGQRVLKSENKHLFCDLKTSPILGSIFRSILAQRWEHFGSILVIKNDIKCDEKGDVNTSSILSLFGTKMVSKWIHPFSPKPGTVFYHSGWVGF